MNTKTGSFLVLAFLVLCGGCDGESSDGGEGGHPDIFPTTQPTATFDTMPCSQESCTRSACVVVTVSAGEQCPVSGTCIKGSCVEEPVPVPPADPDGASRCTGCTQRGSCNWAPDAHACGSNGDPCEPCLPGVCQVAYCLDGTCAIFTAPDNTACDEGNGICTAGLCTPL